MCTWQICPTLAQHRCFSLLQTGAGGQKAQPRHSLLLASRCQTSFARFPPRLYSSGRRWQEAERQHRTARLLTFKCSNQPSQSFLVCDLALHQPVNQRAASSSLSQISWGPHPPAAFQGSSQVTTSLPPAADLGTTRGRCCFRFPSLLVPAPRRASVPTPFPAHSWGRPHLLCLRIAIRSHA